MKKYICLIMVLSFQYILAQDTIFVNSVRRLKEVLKGNDKIIFIEGSSKLDFSKEETIEIPEGINLVSNRGKDGSLGALFFTNNFATRPMFVIKNNNVKIKGIRFKGPDIKIRQKEKLKQKVALARKQMRTKREIQLIDAYGVPNSIGLMIYGKNILITNCENYGWSHSAIYIQKKGQVEIGGNYIHHNQRYGIGYGVQVKGTAEIHHNEFDFNRHAIASDGNPEANYHAHHNICLENSGIQSHIFDVHGGIDRKDGTDIAGKKFTVNDNIFFIKNHQQVFRIRGKSLEKTKVYNNQIFLLKEGVEKKFIVQSGGKGNLEVRKNKTITLIKQ